MRTGITFSNVEPKQINILLFITVALPDNPDNNVKLRRLAALDEFKTCLQ
jgi:hypothetical protein